MAVNTIIPELPAREDWPPALAALRGDRQRKFAWAYLFSGGEGMASARAAGYSDTGEACKVRAFELLQRDDIQAALREISTKYLFSLAPKAIVRLGELLDKPDNHKHFDAIRLTMASTLFPERTSIEHHHSGTIELSHTDAALEALTYLRSMAVPREKLVEQFGHSGLVRYEKMLEEQETKKGMKVIEEKVDRRD
jgi:hypothetical protein